MTFLPRPPGPGRGAQKITAAKSADYFWSRFTCFGFWFLFLQPASKQITLCASFFCVRQLRFSTCWLLRQEIWVLYVPASAPWNLRSLRPCPCVRKFTLSGFLFLFQRQEIGVLCVLVSASRNLRAVLAWRRALSSLARAIRFSARGCFRSLHACHSAEKKFTFSALLPLRPEIYVLCALASASGNLRSLRSCPCVRKFTVSALLPLRQEIYVLCVLASAPENLRAVLAWRLVRSSVASLVRFSPCSPCVRKFTFPAGLFVRQEIYVLYVLASPSGNLRSLRSCLRVKKFHVLDFRSP